MLVDAEPYNPVHYTELCYPFLVGHISFSLLSRKITSVVKLYFNRRVQLEAREFLRECVSKIPWLCGSTSSTFDTLHSTPVKVIPSFSRLAILRWLLDSEADMHFRLRPHVTRNAPCRCGCGELSSTYPNGFAYGSLAESHLHFPVFCVAMKILLPWTVLLIQRFIHPSHRGPLLLGSRVMVPPIPLLAFSPHCYKNGLAFPVCYAVGEIIQFSTGYGFVLSLLWLAATCLIANGLGTGFSTLNTPHITKRSLVHYG